MCADVEIYFQPFSLRERVRSEGDWRRASFFKMAAVVDWYSDREKVLSSTIFDDQNIAVVFR